LFSLAVAVTSSTHSPTSAASPVSMTSSVISLKLPLRAGQLYEGNILLSRDLLRGRGETELSDHRLRSGTGLSFDRA